MSTPEQRDQFEQKSSIKVTRNAKGDAQFEAKVEQGARVIVVDFGSPSCGEYGTVTVPEYPAVLTGRPMVDVHLDGHPHFDDEGFYVQQLEELRLQAVAA